MTTITALIIEADDPDDAEKFYAATAFDIDIPVRVERSAEPTDGFRGFTFSIVAPRPAAVDALIDRARSAGATVLKPGKKSLWGYGGAVQAPDGSVWTFASGKKDSGTSAGEIDRFVVQLGPSDVKASKAFYTARGFDVAKSYGSKYVEFDAGPVTLALTKQANLSKVTGMSAGTGSHRVRFACDTAAFTDPDGFVWI
ncbi:glyoxalase [Gordonia humi]|uniref:Putative lactoylglutathione lyase n=1 Tax=Gordonia humi TaxID=686429 RepID=A0A840EUV6_9ACTN|nr:glyoxalase [Gordonia humi]MBB4134134.1 putative lactoylglutathione lyase [Gordonia humi]